SHQRGGCQTEWRISSHPLSRLCCPLSTVRGQDLSLRPACNLPPGSRAAIIAFMTERANSSRRDFLTGRAAGRAAADAIERAIDRAAEGVGEWADQLAAAEEENHARPPGYVVTF